MFISEIIRDDNTNHQKYSYLYMLQNIGRFSLNLNIKTLHIMWKLEISIAYEFNCVGGFIKMSARLQTSINIKTVTLT